MNFKQLEAFFWLTRLHSFQAVANHIGLTQPAVSARIAALEEEFGIRLVDREGNGFRLTGPGHEVAEFAERFFDLREAMEARLKQKQRSRFAIGLVGMAGFGWGSLLRRRLAEAEPGLVVDVQIGANPEILRQVEAGALDMAFVTGTAGLEQLPGSFAVRYEVGWVARPDVVAPRDRAFSAAELRALPLVLYPPTSPLHAPVNAAIEETAAMGAPRHYGNAMTSIAEMVRQGFGAAALPLSPLEAELGQGLLVRLPAEDALPPLDVRCVHLDRARRKLAARIFALAEETARDWCAAHPHHAAFLEPG